MYFGNSSRQHNVLKIFTLIFSAFLPEHQTNYAQFTFVVPILPFRLLFCFRFFTVKQFSLRRFFKGFSVRRLGSLSEEVIITTNHYQQLVLVFDWNRKNTFTESHRLPFRILAQITAQIHTDLKTLKCTNCFLHFFIIQKKKKGKFFLIFVFRHFFFFRFLRYVQIRPSVIPNITPPSLPTTTATTTTAPSAPALALVTKTTTTKATNEKQHNTYCLCSVCEQK